MWNLAQASTGLYGNPTSTSTNTGFLIGIGLVYLVVLFIIFWANWRIFVKAGEPGWKALIPIYNTITLLNIVGFSGWYVLLFFVPFVNILFALVLVYKLSKAFGHDIGMAILMIIVVGYLILAFGSSKYVGPDGKASAETPNSGGQPQPPAPPVPPTTPAPPNLVQ